MVKQLVHIFIITILLTPVNAFAGKYDDAVAAARQALYKQSGLEFYVDNAEAYGQKEANRYLREIGLGELAGVIGFTAKSLYNKKVILKYGKLGIEVSEGKSQLTLTWRF